ncbi:MAG: Gfo/Idh/MocA family oxidoreductase [Gemmatimonadetes bacterium]|nr:Gfo/Idh/MocA family oxidoreductase [Gemmatimonadota bacterium]
MLSTSHIGRVAVIPAILASRNGTLVAVASRDGQRARAYAEETGIPGHHGSYDALLRDERIDAVYIPLPNSMHGEWTVRAAEQGKHVLCEKPLAPTESECHEMEAAAAANGVEMMEAFMYRFHPRTEKVLELTRAGTIGEVRMMRSTFSFRITRPDNIRLKPELGGGALLDVGCYCVNLSRLVAGAEPILAQAIARWSATGVDEQLAGTLRFADGLIAQFDCGLSLERRERYEITGTDGHLIAETAFLPGTGETVLLEDHGRSGAPVEHRVDGADPYRLMVEHFADCVLAGRALRWPAREAALNLRTIDALFRSARTGGAPIAIPAASG